MSAPISRALVSPRTGRMIRRLFRVEEEYWGRLRAAEIDYVRDRGGAEGSPQSAAGCR